MGMDYFTFDIHCLRGEHGYNPTEVACTSTSGRQLTGWPISPPHNHISQTTVPQQRRLTGWPISVHAVYHRLTILSPRLQYLNNVECVTADMMADISTRSVSPSHNLFSQTKLTGWLTGSVHAVYHRLTILSPGLQYLNNVECMTSDMMVDISTRCVSPPHNLISRTTPQQRRLTGWPISVHAVYHRLTILSPGLQYLNNVECMTSDMMADISTRCVSPPHNLISRTTYIEYRQTS
ncbi:hypothetical protein J6590_039938 [Homalodisca vitripennis]|nr:hypothetical protein J6590_039938 [Homalodisca vitripennis]